MFQGLARNQLRNNKVQHVLLHVFMAECSEMGSLAEFERLSEVPPCSDMDNMSCNIPSQMECLMVTPEGAKRANIFFSPL